MKSTVLALIIGSVASAATAQHSFCGNREEIVRTLEQKYGEKRRGMGLQNAQTVLEIFASDTTGTWTLVVSRTDGSACAVAAGQAWRSDATAALPDSPI